MKSTLFWTWFAALLFCSVTASPAAAQPDAGSDSGTRSDAGAEAEPDVDAAAGTGGVEADADADELPPEAASDAKRMVRIRKTIELDTQHLRWLRSEHRSREKWFEDLAAAMAELSEERSDKREQLEALEEDLEEDPEADQDTAEALRAVRVGGLGGGDAGDVLNLPLLGCADCPEVVVGLEVEPELCGGSEVACEPQRGVRGDSHFALDDPGNARVRHAGILGQLVLADFERLEEFLEQDFSWGGFFDVLIHYLGRLVFIRDSSAW